MEPGPSISMMAKANYYLIFALLTVNVIKGLKIFFDPNKMMVKENPSDLRDLMLGLFKVEYYEVLLSFLRTQASDYTKIYCDSWNKLKAFSKISKSYSSGKINKSQLRDLLLPECVKISHISLNNLNENQIRLIPRSLLQVESFPVQYLLIDNLEIVLNLAVSDRPHNPKICWSSWILNPELDFHTCPKSTFFYKFGWQLVNHIQFPKLSDMKQRCLMEWLLNESEEDFMKNSDENIMMRSLTLFAWNSPVKSKHQFKKRLSKRFCSNSSMILSKKFIREENFEISISLLIRIISILESGDLNQLIGDWFIGILGIWRESLNDLRLEDNEKLIYLQKIFTFLFDSIEINFEGLRRIKKLFHETLQPFIEEKIIKKFSKENLTEFYREFPDYFQYNFPLISLEIRFNSFLRNRRAFHKDYDTLFQLNYKYFDTEPINLNLHQNFLEILSENIRNGVEDLERISLNPETIKLNEKIISFEDMTKYFLISVTKIPNWFFPKTITEDNSFIFPSPIISDLFWELLGYFMIQSKILDIPIPFKICREFFLEMMKSEPSNEFIEKVSDPFKLCPINHVSVLSRNLNYRFTISSIYLSSESSSHLTDNSKNLASKLYIQGMKSMRKGINHVLGSFKFLPEELYLFLFN